MTMNIVKYFQLLILAVSIISCLNLHLDISDVRRVGDTVHRDSEINLDDTIHHTNDIPLDDTIITNDDLTLKNNVHRNSEIRSLDDTIQANSVISLDETIHPNSETSLHDTINPIIYDDPEARLDVRNLYSHIQKYYLPVPRTIVDNDDCKKVINKFLINLTNGLSSWALKMGDSWGKIPDGFLFGNIHAIGMFEECLMVEGEAGLGEKPVSFGGKYCTIHYKTPNVSISLPWKRDDNPYTRSGPGMIVLLQPMPFYYATCIPSVCTAQDLFVSLNKTLAPLNREVATVVCTDDSVRYLDQFDAFDIFVCTFLLCLASLAILGTSFDECHKAGILTRDTRDCASKTYIGYFIEFLKCFSLTDSFKSIFGYRSKTEKDITCLHGLRVITLVWIMTCHQYETAIQFSANTRNAKKYQDPLFGQFITNGYGAVDTFFFISGLLVAYRMLPAVLSKKSSIFKFAFIRRVARLLPSIFLVASFSATLLRFLGWGPRHPYLQGWVMEQCRGNWWKDPLFINNYPIGDNLGVSVADCLGHCWYTAVEMQLFILTPFIFWPFMYNRKSGNVLLAMITSVSIIIPVAVIIYYQIPPLPMPYLSASEHYIFMTKYYLVPWCRSAPWFVGICIGILLVNVPRVKARPHKVFIAIGYLFVILVGFAFVLGAYNYNHIGEHSEMKIWLSAVYALTSRPVWGLALAWVVLTCHYGHSGYVNYFLSWWGWQPLSRLTFGMYLIHPVVQVWWSTVLFLPVYYSYLGKLFETCGVFFTSFVLAFLLSSLVERPFLKMTRHFSSGVVQSEVISKQRLR